MRKLLLLFDARELSDVEDYAHAQEFNRFFVVPWLGFAVIGPLALVGLIAVMETCRWGSPGRSPSCPS